MLRARPTLAAVALAATAVPLAYAAGSVPTAAVRIAHAANTPYPNATLTGSYTVTYQASGDVPNESGSGSTLASDSYSYTVDVNGLPIQAASRRDPGTGFNGEAADFEEPTEQGRPVVSRYETVSNVHFLADDPMSNGTCPTVLHVEPTGAASPQGGLQVETSKNGSGSGLSGTSIAVPAEETYWSAQDSPCQHQAVDLLITPAAPEDDQVRVLSHRGTPTAFTIGLGSWFADGVAYSFGNNDSSLFAQAPTTTCTGGVPTTWARDSGSCTETNKDVSNNANLRATISWSFTTAGIPAFHGRILKGDHQTLHPGELARTPLEVQVLFPNGRRIYDGDLVRLSVKGPARVYQPNPNYTNSSGVAEFSSIRARHRTGRVTITARIDNAAKPVVFHLLVKR